MKELKSIILTFENCDSMEISIKYISGLHIRGISDSIEQVNYSSGEIETRKSAENIFLTVRNSKKLTYKPFNLFESDTVFNRITKFPDITHITVVYSDESRQKIAVPYEPVHGDDNKHQSVTYLHSFDDLVVTIKKLNC